jgi:hypothetical protein
MALYVRALRALGLFHRPCDAVVAAGLVAAVGAFSNLTHHASDVEGHWLEALIYFHDLRALHYSHHQGTAAHNCAPLDFGSDAALPAHSGPQTTALAAAAARRVANLRRPRSQRPCLEVAPSK